MLRSELGFRVLVAWQSSSSRELPARLQVQEQSATSVELPLGTLPLATSKRCQSLQGVSAAAPWIPRCSGSGLLGAKVLGCWDLEGSGFKV